MKKTVLCLGVATSQNLWEQVALGLSSVTRPAIKRSYPLRAGHFLAAARRLSVLFFAAASDAVLARADRSSGLIFKLAFSSSGADATVTIAHEDSPATLTKVQTLTTKPGARTMAVDPSTHRIYLAVPDFEPLARGQTGRPKSIPGTFRVLVYEMRAGSASR